MLRHLRRTVNLLDTTSMLFVCLLCACRGDARGRSGLVYYETYDPRSLHPALSTDVPTGEMVTLLFDGLTEVDPNGRLLPGLADPSRAEPSGPTFRLQLRLCAKVH